MLFGHEEEVEELLSSVLLAMLVDSLLSGYFPLEAVGPKNLPHCEGPWGGRQEELEAQCLKMVTWQMLA